MQSSSLCPFCSSSSGASWLAHGLLYFKFVWLGTTFNEMSGKKTLVDTSRYSLTLHLHHYHNQPINPLFTYLNVQSWKLARCFHHYLPPTYCRFPLCPGGWVMFLMTNHLRFNMHAKRAISPQKVVA